MSCINVMKIMGELDRHEIVSVVIVYNHSCDPRKYEEHRYIPLPENDKWLYSYVDEDTDPNEYYDSVRSFQPTSAVNAKRRIIRAIRQHNIRPNDVALDIEYRHSSNTDIMYDINSKLDKLADQLYEGELPIITSLNKEQEERLYKHLSPTSGLIMEEYIADPIIEKMGELMTSLDDLENTISLK